MKFIIIVVIVFASIFTAYFMTKDKMEEKHLPFIQPTDLKAEMVDESLLQKGLNHRIGKFSFQNQYNEEITLDDVKGKVFVAEYFFTTCGTICPKMTAQMERVQFKFSGNNNFKILSFTVHPEVDTVEVMHRYAKNHHAEKGQWHFLTGDKKDLYHLARTSFFVLKPAEAANLGDVGSDFIHTNNFVLVDQELRIRGYYDGTSPSEVDELMEDIELLLEEK